MNLYTHNTSLVPAITNSISISHCPYCNHDKFYRIRRNKFYCSKCRREWSFRKNTELEYSTLSLEKYNKIMAMIQNGKSVSCIAKEVKSHYYTVYKLYYKYNKDTCPKSSGIIRQYKERLHETNFSIAQSTNMSTATVSKIVSSLKKYRIHPMYFIKTYDYLENEIAKIKKSGNRKKNRDKNQDQTLSLQVVNKLSKKQWIYATDVLFLAMRIENTDFINHIPEHFFYDYLYKANVNKKTMAKTLQLLHKKGYIELHKGLITKSIDIAISLSKRKQNNLISSLAAYCDKTNDSPQAYEWAMFLNNKKAIDNYLVKALIFYENKSDFTKRQIIITKYEKKYKRTSSYVYATLLYHKTYINGLYLGKLPNQFRFTRSFLSSSGVINNKYFAKEPNYLDFEIHSIFFSMYENFRNLDCVYIAIRTKEYYLNYIHSQKYTPYHLLIPNYHLIDTNNKVLLSQQIQKLLQISTIDQYPKFFQNAYYTFFLFYYITECNEPLINQYYSMLENNGDQDISPINMLTRYDSLFLIFFAKRNYDFAFVVLLQWACEAHDNKYRLFNILIYLRIVLTKLITYDIVSFVDYFFKKPFVKKTYLCIAFTPDKTFNGLQQILKLCQVHTNPEIIDTSQLIHWLDNFMIAFRQKTYTKKMLKTCTYRFIRKIRKIDKTIEKVSDEEFIQILKSILSFKQDDEKNRIPHASSENLILLHSSYYCLYEHLFLPEKTVSKKFPPIVPHYIQRLLDS